MLPELSEDNEVRQQQVNSSSNYQLVYMKRLKFLSTDNDAADANKARGMTILLQT